MDVGAWLRGLGLEDYAEAFAENGIDAALLPELTNEDLKDLGILRIVDRKRLLKAIAELLEDNGQADAASSSLVSSAGEIRQVTVLFADLAGFTQLSDELGAEPIHALLNRYFEIVDGIVERYGGSIDKHMGDNVMAVFGAPVAHSDDTQRAARAALDIHKSMSLLSDEFSRPLHAHIGLASGQVVASGTGSAAHREYTVTGSSVNLASRLQDRAEAGQTLVSQAVQRAIADLAETTPMGEIAVKGYPESVPVWRLEELHSDALAARRSPFVGRQGERRRFNSLIRKCVETGTGGGILVRGEAGIGKTRLIEEFVSLAEAKGFAIHKGQVLDFGVGKGQDAVRALVRSLIYLAGSADKAARTAAANRAVETGWLEADARVFLNDLLDLPQPLEMRALYDAMDNKTRNSGKQAVVASLVRSSSKTRPLLVVVEDIHWADPLTLAHLASIASAVANCPAVLVMASRVEDDPLNQAGRSSLSGCPLTTMDVQPLDVTEAEELARGFIETGGAFIQDCIDRAEGNPLFLEQLLRNAEEGSLSEVPGSIQSLVLARMDHLKPRDKQAIQSASIIGQRFARDALRVLLEDTAYDCNALVEHHLIRPEGHGFIFSHALIQEGVYSSLLQSQRRALHRRAASWFADQDPVLHAEHLDRAEDPEAPEAYLKAAKVHAEIFRFDSAFHMAERGYVLARTISERLRLGLVRAELLRELGRAEEAIDVFRDLLKLATDDSTKCRALIGVASCVRLLGGSEEGFKALDEAEPLARHRRAALELSQISYYRGCLLFSAGDADGCLAQHEQARDAAIQAGDPECEAQALSGLGDAYYARGKMKRAIEQFSRCRTICRQHGFGRIEVGSTHMIGVVRRYLNEFKEGIEDLRAAASAAAKVGNARTEMVAQTLLGELLIDRGDLAGAYEALDRALNIVDTFHNLRYRAYIMYELGRARWYDVERRDMAEPTLEEALALCRETELSFMGPRVLAAKALVTQSETERRAMLKEGEKILRSGCLPHVFLWFYRDAIETALDGCDWSGVERYATGLETYTRPEPLPWAEFFISRGRALAAFGSGKIDDTTIREIKRLHDEGESIGLNVALPALKTALASSRL